MPLAPALLLFALLVASDSDPEVLPVLRGSAPKALVIFIDGFLPGVITPEIMPNVHHLLEEGAWSLRARVEDTTISGSGWSTFLTGVHRDKHGVRDNSFAEPRFERYPHFFARLREGRPGTVCASAQSWRPIQDLIVAPASPDFNFFAEYYLANDDYFDAISVDSLCAEAGRLFLAQPAVDVVVVMFAESDGTGHLEGNAHYDAEDPLYRRQLTKIDGHVGELLTAIESRAGIADEAWLVAIHTDHAGAKNEGHGRNVPAHRQTPFLLKGPGITRGQIFPPPKSPDLVATILHHFGVIPDPAWELDGAPVAVSRTGPKRAWFGENLLVNGDAQRDCGFSGLGEGISTNLASAIPAAPDASVAGWDDPGLMTVVEPGEWTTFGSLSRMFANGGSKSEAILSQRVDLAPIVPWIRQQHASFSSSATFYAGTEQPSGIVRLDVIFFDREGREIDRATSSPAVRSGSDDSDPKSMLSGDVPLDAWSAEVRLTLAPHEDGRHLVFADDLELSFSPRTRRALPPWRDLFNGRDLDGWIPVNVAPETFTVHDGMIVCDGIPTGVLRTRDVFENFECEFEYRHMKTGGNAGFFVWSDALPSTGQPFTRSVEVQVIDGWETENWTSHGDIFAIWGAVLQPDRPHPAGWMRCLPSERRARGTGQWNHFRIIAVDGSLQLWVNGAPVSGGSEISPRRGYLCPRIRGIGGLLSQPPHP